MPYPIVLIGGAGDGRRLTMLYETGHVSISEALATEMRDRMPVMDEASLRTPSLAHHYRVATFHFSDGPPVRFGVAEGMTNGQAMQTLLDKYPNKGEIS